MRPLMELLYTSFCSTDLVLLIELLALQDVSSTEAALVYSLEPVSGALLVSVLHNMLDSCYMCYFA
jgi:threonine/homoserine efflux transporter RhtA